MVLVSLTQPIDLKYNDHTQMQTLKLCMLNRTYPKFDPKMYNWIGDSTNNNDEMKA